MQPLRSSIAKHRSRWICFVREGVGMALPACVVAVLLFVTPKEGGTQGERHRPPGEPKPDQPCGVWHRGGGETSGVDLAAVKKAYNDLADDVARSLRGIAPRGAEQMERRFDAGIPACRGTGIRTTPLSPERAARFRGKLLYFVDAPTPESVTLPTEVERDPRAEILILRTNKLKHVAELSRLVGKPVSLAGAGFARSLGVTCSNTWVKLTEKGDGLELHEGR